MHGYTFTEVLVAAGLLMGSAASLTYFLQTNKGTKSNAGEACVNHVNQIMSRITQQGLDSTDSALVMRSQSQGQLNFLPGPMPDTTKVIDANEVPFGIAQADRNNPSNPEMIDKTPSPMHLNNAFLLNGSMAALQSIYNSNAAFCDPVGNGAAYTGEDPNNNSLNITDDFRMWQGSNIDPTNNGGNATRTFINIRTFALEAGGGLSIGQTDPACLPRPIFLQPKAQGDPPNAYAEPNLDRGSLIRDDRGFLVTITAEYDELNLDAGGVHTKSCQITQKFQYPRDSELPPAPDVNTTNVIVYNGTNRCGSAPRNQSVNFPKTIGFSVGLDGAEGSVVLCRDRSLRRLPVTGNVDEGYRPGGGNDPDGIRTELCMVNQHTTDYRTLPQNYNGDDLTGTQPINNTKQCFVARSSNATDTYATTDAYGIVPGDTWVPCESLVICDPNGPVNGATVSAATLVNNGTNVQYNLTFQIDDEHFGCDIRIDAALVDPAGNLGPITTVQDALHVDDNNTSQPGGTGDICWDPHNHYFDEDYRHTQSMVDFGNEFGNMNLGTYFWSCDSNFENTCPTAVPFSFDVPNLPLAQSPVGCLNGNDDNFKNGLFDPSEYPSSTWPPPSGTFFYNANDARCGLIPYEYNGNALCSTNPADVTLRNDWIANHDAVGFINCQPTTVGPANHPDCAGEGGGQLLSAYCTGGFGL